MVMVLRKRKTQLLPLADGTTNDTDGSLEATQSTGSLCFPHAATARRRHAKLAAGCLLALLLVSYSIWGRSFYFALRSDIAVEQRRRFHDASLVQGTVYLRSITDKMRKQWTTPPTSANHQVCLAIGTRRRKAPYIHALLASLLKGNNASDIAACTIHILNSEYPANHNLDLSLIQEQVPFIHIHHAYNETESPSRNTVYNTNHNYVKLLGLCQEQNFDWTIAIEDDTVLVHNFLNKAANLLSSLSNRTNNTALVKLFWSDRWDGFENQQIPNILLYCVMTSILVVLLVIQLLHICCCFLGTNHHQGIITRQDAILVIVWMTLILLCNAVLIGRQNLIMAREALLHHLNDKSAYRLVPLINSHHRAHGQVMAYAQSQAARAMEYLNQHVASKYFDVLLTREYLHETGQEAFLAQPVLAQHIGVYSSFSHKNQGDFEFLGQNEGFDPN